ncbi:UNVERIFIED_CONTAM: hypothetical protein GTU68_025041 [Idotea baltica]|nr:hypothetical protein [Idotea baltica]
MTSWFRSKRVAFAAATSTATTAAPVGESPLLSWATKLRASLSRRVQT